MAVARMEELTTDQRRVVLALIEAGKVGATGVTEETIVVKKPKVSERLDTATEESLLFLTKAFRGAVRMEEPENRVLLSAASATVGAWSRYQATASAERQTDVVLANMFARDLGGKATDYLPNLPKAALSAGPDQD